MSSINTPTTFSSSQAYEPDQTLFGVGAFTESDNTLRRKRSGHQQLNFVKSSNITFKRKLTNQGIKTIVVAKKL